MIRSEIAPTPALRGDVKCFWMLEKPPDTFNTDVIIPDPYIELIINCGAPLSLSTNEGRTVELPRVFFNSLQTRPQRFQTDGLCQLVAMRMYPWVLPSLVDDYQELPGTSLLAAGTQWESLAGVLVEKVQHQGYSEALYCLQESVIEMRRKVHADLNPVRAAAELLFATCGQSRVGELAARLYLSTSQFERRFKESMGVTPKTFARLIRFRAICEALIYDPTRPAIALAHDFGYTDQSHLIRDFKAFSSQTPGNYVANSKESVRYWQSAEFLQYA